MVRRIYDPADARRLLNAGSVALVTASWRDMVGATPVSWVTSLSMEPPMVGVSIRGDRHIADLVRSSGEFALNLPGATLMKQTAYLGSVSGVDHQKIEEAGLSLFPALRVQAPLIEGCLAWMECDVVNAIPIGDHILFVGEVYKVQALDEAYEQVWKLERHETSPLVYLGGTSYAVPASRMDAHVEVDAQGALIAETAEEREQREEREALEAERRLHDPEAPPAG